MLTIFKTVLKHSIYSIINLIEKYEFRNIQLDQDDPRKKILNTIDLTNYEVSTDTGFKPLSNIHLTQPYKVYDLFTETKHLSCADNHIVFDSQMSEVFVKDLHLGQYIMTDNGPEEVTSIVKRPYDLAMYDVTVNDQNHRLWTNGILSHNTVTSAIFLCWFMIFHYEKNTLLMANKGATTKEIVDKIKNILEGLPFFLKPGIMKKDVTAMTFDNKCRLISQNTTKSSAIGFTIHLLFLDEFAHVQENIKRSFYNNVYPTLSSSKTSRIIITSTTNGYELFQEIYQGAVDGLNSYTPIRVDWWDHPDRDDKWKENEVQNLGSEEAFNEQYGNTFLNASSLLLGSAQILKMESIKTDFVFREIGCLDDLNIDYSQLKWHPNFDLAEIEDPTKFFVIGLDLSEGVGRDYTIANIFRIDLIEEEYLNSIKNLSSISDFFGLTQVGIFRSNEHSLIDFAKVLYALSVDMFDSENLRLLLEYNTYGAELISKLLLLYPEANDFDEEIFVKFKHRNNSKVKEFGIRYNSENKPLFAEKFKDITANGRMILSESTTCQEAKMFSRITNGTFSAQTGNDDIMISSITASGIIDTLDFIEITEELYDTLPDDVQKKLDKIQEKFEKTNDDIYDIF